jgi:hypothetical protein
VAEALPHRTGVDGATELEPTGGSQGKPALRGVLILAFAHLPACSVPNLRAAPDRLFCSLGRQPGQSLAFNRQRSSELSGLDRDMHYMIAAEHRAKLYGRQRRHHRHIGRAREKAPPFFAAAVGCLNDQSGPPNAQPFPRPLITSHSLASAAGQAQQLHHPAHQTRPDAVQEIRRHVHRTTRRPGKRAARPRGF